MFLQVYYIDETTKKISNKSILLLFGCVFCTVLIKAHNNDCIKQKKNPWTKISLFLCTYYWLERGCEKYHLIVLLWCNIVHNNGRTSYTVSTSSTFLVAAPDWLSPSNHINREKGKVGKIDQGVYDVLSPEAGQSVDVDRWETVELPGISWCQVEWLKNVEGERQNGYHMALGNRDQVGVVEYWFGATFIISPVLNVLCCLMKSLFSNWRFIVYVFCVGCCCRISDIKRG